MSPNEWLFEIRHNLKVAGAHWADQDGTSPPLFAVDVAVVHPSSVPNHEPGTKKGPNDVDWAHNEALLTFAEVKKLVAYPMLLAQFLGVVHELKPKYVIGAASEFTSDGIHPPPILFTSQHLTKGSQTVLESFSRRGIGILAIENVDVLPDQELLQRMRGERQDPGK